ncbi:MAG: hypothetical protein M3Q30_13800 [Actinomycetota bacterium]|nr:hypothetical protein [Actinomycetota bacterium]
MAVRAIVIGAAVVVLTFTGGCGSGERNATPVVKVANAAPTTAPLMLAQFDKGVGAVSTESSAPTWFEPGAVAALDGSAIFSIRHDDTAGSDRLARIDPRRGGVSATWPLRSGLSIDAVAPAGQWVALTDRRPGYGSQGRASTEVVVFDPRAGAEVHRRALTGDVQPEAFSVDGARMFALDYRGDHYRVQTIELRTGLRYDTSDRNKVVAAEDMRGRAVHGVMSADRTLLATLYRNPGDADEPAFVHVLDLENGWSYCADLPAPFGTGPPGTDAIELTPGDTVIVAATPAQRLAEIHIVAVHTPGTSPVPVTFRAGTIPPPSSAFASMPGFGYVIATLPA